MKRLIGSLLVVSAVGMAVAQAPFTIVRPADGSRIRETVRVLFPKGSAGSIPRNPQDARPDPSYVGIFVGGRFIEATLLKEGQQYDYYELDTKKLGLADGPVTIEAVKYIDFDEKPRIVDRTSVEVTIGNKSNINVPDDGMLLRYKFQAGNVWRYKLQTQTRIATITQNEARSGAIPASTSIEGLNFRYMYAIDNTYSDRDALLRLQVIPDAGKDYATVLIAGEDRPRRVYKHQFHPLYMRIKNTGVEEFTDLPRYFPLEGTPGEPFRYDVMGLFPLPSLPEQAVRPGDPFSARIHISDLDLENAHKDNDMVANLPARGEFLGVEWEMGHPCAKLRYSLAIGSGTQLPRGASSGMSIGGQTEQISENAQSIEDVFWFALDKGAIIKWVHTSVVDMEVGNANVGNIFGQGNPFAAGGDEGGGAGGPGGGAVGARGATGQGRPTAAGASSGTPPQGGGGPQMAGTSSGSAQGGRSGGQGGANRLLRIASERIMILVK